LQINSHAADDNSYLSDEFQNESHESSAEQHYSMDEPVEDEEEEEVKPKQKLMSFAG
jgi:hypothetical protein